MTAVESGAGTENGGEVLYEAHPSMLRTSPFLFVLSILLIAAFGLGILILLVWFVRTRMDHIMITRSHVVWTHGLLSKSSVEFDIGAVRTVRVNQSLLQRLLDSGDVAIFTAGDNAEITVPGLPHPARVRELLKG